MSEEPCPLCQKSKDMRKPKQLYGTPVCKKCYYRFANRRQLAYFLDWFFWRVLMMFIGAAIGVIAAMSGGQDSEALGLVLTLMTWLLVPVFALKDGFTGQSPGKAICDVQVVDERTGDPAGFVASFKRNLVLLVPFVPLIVAFLLCKGSRWGDGWAKTRVVWKRYADHPVFRGGLRCENCQYDLTGNTSGACPECGKPLSANNLALLAEQNAAASADGSLAAVE